MARSLQRPVRENVTPLVLQKAVWAGANLGSYQQATAALQELAGIELTGKQVQRMTSQVGGDAVAQRNESVAKFRQRPLQERTTPPAAAKPQELAVVMMDGGRFQRRDHFRDRHCSPSEPAEQTASTPTEKTTHWREDKVGIVLCMQSEVHDRDPSPEFPEWLAAAEVVAELAQLAAAENEAVDNGPSETTPSGDDHFPLPLVEGQSGARDWKGLAPKLLSREVIASSESAEVFGWHLESKAWKLGIHAARRQAFVADGLAVNWVIHKRHFSQTVGILDLMHALSYAWRAAAALDDRQAYRRYARWIWQGQVQQVIDELLSHQRRLGRPPADASQSDPRQRIGRAITYYSHHKTRMNYPAYRRRGLPLTSSHMESTIKQINARVKGTEKFWNAPTGESILQLRADGLSDSQPLKSFWQHWRSRQTGTNRYRKLIA